MKKFNLWMLAAIMTICGATALTSCSEKIDAPVVPVNPTEEVTETELSQALLGLHVDATDYVVGEDAIRVWDMKANNTFIAYDLYYDDDLTFVVDTIRGSWKPLLNQAPWWDKNAKEKLNGFTVVYEREDDLPFEGNEVDETYFAFMAEDEEDDDDEGELFFLTNYAVNELATLDQEETEQNAQARTRAANLGNTSTEAINTIGQGLAGGVTTQEISTVSASQKFFDKMKSSLSTAGAKKFYNPNEAKKLFTRDNWRDQDIILLYVDKNTGTQTETVGNNTYNFLEVALPWSKNTKSSNLPLDFCDDITPGNGWDLVMNSCGNTGAQNENFFALYNKYTGILRVFTFVPVNFNVSTANDHAWEVTLSKDLAQHLNLKFGLPISNQLVNKALVGMDRGSDHSLYVTPYVSSSSTDQKITPNPGWWAFDIDLSLYRPGFTTLNQELRLQMRAWNEDKVTLSSKVNMQIKEKHSPETFGFNSILGIVGLGKKGYTSVSDLISNFGNIATGGWGDALKALVNVVTTGIDVFSGIKGEIGKIGASTEPFYVTKQYIDGTISTDGLHSGSRAVSGIQSPTFSLADFETQHSLFGQGVWNLKHAPVVYQFDREYYTYTSSGPKVLDIYEITNGNIFAFDPTSVEVELNPAVFPKDKIEYMEVKSICGSFTDRKPDANDNYRQAFGMAKNSPVFSHGEFSNIVIKEINPAIYDSQSDYNPSDQAGRFLTKDKYFSEGKSTFKMIGRGGEKYMLDPNLIRVTDNVSDKYANSRIPCFEVTVALIVKLKGINEPLEYTRKYLPEVMPFYLQKSKYNISQMAKKLEVIKNDPMQKGHTGQLEKQVDHFKNIVKTLAPDYYQQASNDYTLKSSGYYKNDELFDGNPNNFWYSNSNGKGWNIYFESSRPISPKSYALTTGPMTMKDDGNPKRWGLYGQKADGSWALLDWRDAGANESERLPTSDYAKMKYPVRSNQGTYQKFKFYIAAHWGVDSQAKEYFTWRSNTVYLAELEVFENESPVTITVERSSGEPSGFGAKNLFDDAYKTEWHSNQRVDGKWFVEFKTSSPISPLSYFFITGLDSGKYYDRTPQAWKVYGKKNAGDEWTVLSDLDIENDKGEAWIPGANMRQTRDFAFNKQQPQDMQYFRLEISRSFGSDAVQLNEMIFNY